MITSEHDRVLELKRTLNLYIELTDQAFIVRVLEYNWHMNLLLVEDHPKLRANIRQYLSPKGIQITEAITGTEAVDIFAQGKFSVVVLDLGLPLLDGKWVIKYIRQHDQQTPVIVLTSSNLLEDKVGLLELWADDYVTKPFSLEELYARIGAVVRRGGSPIVERVFRHGDSTIDFARAVVLKEWIEIPLPLKELQILEYLASREGMFVSKAELIEKIWWESDEALFTHSTSLEAHISTIRKRIAKDIIITQRWIGYAISKK